MTYLLFDFETTGIKFEDKTIPQRAIQLAWVVVDEERKIVKQTNHMISGNPEINTDFHQHLTTQILDENGKPAKEVIELFHNDVMKVLNNNGVLIAHNIDFDYKVYMNEMFTETGLKIAIDKSKLFCTMKNTIEFCKLPSRYTPRYELRSSGSNKQRKINYKYPKLIELYVTLFGTKPKEQLHDAMNDVMVTVHCFEELRNRGVISDDQIWK